MIVKNALQYSGWKSFQNSIVNKSTRDEPGGSRWRDISLEHVFHVPSNGRDRWQSPCDAILLSWPAPPAKSSSTSGVDTYHVITFKIVLFTCVHTHNTDTTPHTHTPSALSGGGGQAEICQLICRTTPTRGSCVLFMILRATLTIYALLLVFIIADQYYLFSCLGVL